MTGNGTDTVTVAERVNRLEAQLRQEVAARKQLVEVALRLNTALDSGKLLQLIMAAAAELLDAETSSLMLVDEDANELVIEVATGSIGPKAERQRIPIGAGIAGWTLATRQVAIVHDPVSDDRFYPGVGESLQYATRNLLAVPMLVKDRAIGVVEVINKRDGVRFTERDAELASALASLAAVAINNVRLYAQLANAVVTARMSYRL
jgi:phosphoserine phosphatase RsbU/P